MKLLTFACAAVFLGLPRCPAAILNNPIITLAATPFDTPYVAQNVFDSTDNEYASQSRGFGPSLSTTQGTFLEFDFGQAVTMNGFLNATRRNPVDVIITERLIFSNDTFFDAFDTFVDFTPVGSNGNGFLKSFAPKTARYVRWEVLDGALAGGGSNTNNFGSMEMRFMAPSVGLIKLAPTVSGGAPAFNGDYALANAVNGDAGRGGAAGIEYASASLGPNMFVDFDMGSVQPIAGFDFYDRFAVSNSELVDRVISFDLLFSNDPSFSTGVTTRSFTPATWGYHQQFAPVDAQYVRFDATTTASTFCNSGIQEMTFYAAPEPSTAILALCGGIACLRRRRSVC